VSPGSPLFDEAGFHAFKLAHGGREFFARTLNNFVVEPIPAGRSAQPSLTSDATTMTIST
jgi:hypothetical protein